MEMLMPYLLPLLPLSLFLIFFIGRKASNYLQNLPPGSEGWPVVGKTAELAALGIQQLVRDRMQKHSPEVFKTSLFGERMAVVCGAEGNRFVFTNENKLVKPWFPLSLRKAMFPDLDAGRFMEAKSQFLSFKAEALKPEAFKQYTLVMDSLARDHLDHGWRRDPVVKVVPLVQEIHLRVGVQIVYERGGSPSGLGGQDVGDFYSLQQRPPIPAYQLAGDGLQLAGDGQIY